MKKSALLPVCLLALLQIGCKFPTAEQLRDAVEDCAPRPDPAACLGAHALEWAAGSESKLGIILQLLLALWRSTQGVEISELAMAAPSLAAGVSGDPGTCWRLPAWQVESLRRHVAGQGWEVYSSFGPDEAMVALRGLFGCYGLRDEKGDLVMVPGGIPLRGLLEHRKPFAAKRPDPVGDGRDVADCSPTSTWATEGWAEPRRCIALRGSSDAVERNRRRVFGDIGSRGAVDLVTEEIFASRELDPCAPEFADFPGIAAAYLTACADDFVRCGAQDEAWAPVVARAAGVR